MLNVLNDPWAIVLAVLFFGGSLFGLSLWCLSQKKSKRITLWCTREPNTETPPIFLCAGFVEKAR